MTIKDENNALKLTITGRISPRVAATCVKLFRESQGYNPRNYFEAFRTIINGLVESSDYKLSNEEIIMELERFKKNVPNSIGFKVDRLKDLLSDEESVSSKIDSKDPSLAEMFRFVKSKNPEYSDEEVYDKSYFMLYAIMPELTLNEFIKRRKS